MCCSVDSPILHAAQAGQADQVDHADQADQADQVDQADQAYDCNMLISDVAQMPSSSNPSAVSAQSRSIWRCRWFSSRYHLTEETDTILKKHPGKILKKYPRQDQPSSATFLAVLHIALRVLDADLRWKSSVDRDKKCSKVHPKMR